jgi:5-methylcytosine-specific restriction endonuclease McrA
MFDEKEYMRQYAVVNAEALREYRKRWREANKDKTREYAKQWHLDNIERIKAKNRRKYAANPQVALDKAKAAYMKDPSKAIYRAAEWAKANPEKNSEKSRRWASANPDKILATAHKRRAAFGSYAPEDITYLHWKQADLCGRDTPYGMLGCQQPLNGKYEIDHIMPIELGGSNWPENLQLLCRTCNRSKGHRHPEQWAAVVAKRLSPCLA